jgi:aspartate kinase
MFKSLADAKINISHISTSENVLSCIVRREDGHKALQVVHDAFGLDRA